MMAARSAFRKASFWVAGAGGYCTSMYLTYHYVQLTKGGSVCDCGHIDDPLRAQRFDAIAKTYDKDIWQDEFFMGINLLRRMLLFFHAKGNCLEVGAGTCRNLPYYRLSSNVVRRVVVSDASEQMIQQSNEKIGKLPLEKRKRFAALQSDASEISLPSNSFDTVVDTFGLCSFDEPEVVLKEMARLCKPTGKILLLEHGRSHSWDFVTKHLDENAEQHAANWGCVWNRDLDAMLEGARDVMKVEVLHRYHFGTTYYIVCRPIKEENHR